MADSPGAPATPPFPTPPARQLFASGPAEWAELMVRAGRAMGAKRAIGTDDPTRARGPKGGVLAPLALRGVRAKGPLPIYLSLIHI